MKLTAYRGRGSDCSAYVALITGPCKGYDIFPEKILTSGPAVWDSVGSLAGRVEVNVSEPGLYKVRDCGRNGRYAGYYHATRSDGELTVRKVLLDEARVLAGQLATAG